MRDITEDCPGEPEITDKHRGCVLEMYYIVELAREWLISVVIYAMGDGHKWLSGEVRSAAEKVLHDLVTSMKRKCVQRTRA